MLDEDWDVMPSFLPEGWREPACETGALKGLCTLSLPPGNRRELDGCAGVCGLAEREDEEEVSPVAGVGAGVWRPRAGDDAVF